jgi:IS5 family transposase
MTTLSQAVEDASGVSIDKAKRLIAQSRSKKAQVKQHKLYSWQTPEVEWISKGKSRKSYEFGVNVGIATTLKGNFILAARTFSDNSYDGYTLNEQVEQEAILMEASGM